jgi:large subunit ribosomal protein L54
LNGLTRFFTFAKRLPVPSLGKKAGKGKAQATAEKKVFPVETDPEKLVNYVCGSNIMKTGQDIKLQPDNEYPDWLWKMPLGKSTLILLNLCKFNTI